MKENESTIKNKRNLVIDIAIIVLGGTMMLLSIFPVTNNSLCRYIFSVVGYSVVILSIIYNIIFYSESKDAGYVYIPIFLVLLAFLNTNFDYNFLNLIPIAITICFIIFVFRLPNKNKRKICNEWEFSMAIIILVITAFAFLAYIIPQCYAKTIMIFLLKNGNGIFTTSIFVFSIIKFSVVLLKRQLDR